MDFETEKDFEDYLFNLLFDNGFQVYRQVPSNETEQWEQPHRLDLMFRRNDILENQWIGIEIKLFNDLAKGGKVFDAIKQIRRYSTYTFKSERIKYWVFASPHNCSYEEENYKFAFYRTREFVQHFINQIGIGFLDCDNIIKSCSNDRRGIISINDSIGRNRDICKNFIDKIVEELNKIQFL